MTIITRKAAKAAGLRHYFTGKPCSRGHIETRIVSSFCCKACVRENAKKAYDALGSEARKALRALRRPYLQQWEAAHRDRVLSKSKASNQARKETHPNYFRTHYAKNKERRRQESRAWYRANSQRALDCQRLYAANHPEQTRAHGRRAANKRRAIKAKVFVEAVDPATVFARDNGLCGICKRAVDIDSRWEIDHVIPLSLGGAHSYDNVQLAHRKCNRAKGASLPSGQPTLFQVVTPCQRSP